MAGIMVEVVKKIKISNLKTQDILIAEIVWVHVRTQLQRVNKIEVLRGLINEQCEARSCMV